MLFLLAHKFEMVRGMDLVELRQDFISACSLFNKLDIVDFFGLMRNLSVISIHMLHAGRQISYMLFAALPKIY